MSRLLAIGGLILGWGLVLSDSAIQAQQFRTQQLKIPQQAAPPVIINQGGGGNPNNAPGFNVVGGGNALPNNAAGNNANAILNGMNNGTINNPNGFMNPYGAMNGMGYNPYAGNAALDPTNYNMMMYGNPYGVPPGMPINPFYNPYFNPYSFLGGGVPVGASYAGGMPQPTPAQLYNFNFNFQSLSNPLINPLSNPAFSGPFPAGTFNAAAALNLLGAGNILQNFPLPANIGGMGGMGNTGNNGNPFP